MEDSLKKAVSLGVMGSLTAMVLVPASECGEKHICAVENPETWHTHQEQLDPSDAPAVRTITVATAFSTSQYTLLKRGEAPLIFWKGIG